MTEITGVHLDVTAEEKPRKTSARRKPDIATLTDEPLTSAAPVKRARRTAAVGSGAAEVAAPRTRRKSAAAGKAIPDTAQNGSAAPEPVSEAPSPAPVPAAEPRISSPPISPTPRAPSPTPSLSDMPLAVGSAFRTPRGAPEETPFRGRATSGSEAAQGRQTPDRQTSDRQSHDRQSQDRQSQDRQSQDRQSQDRQSQDRRPGGRQGEPARGPRESRRGGPGGRSSRDNGDRPPARENREPMQRPGPAQGRGAASSEPQRGRGERARPRQEARTDNRGGRPGNRVENRPDSRPNPGDFRQPEGRQDARQDHRRDNRQDRRQDPRQENRQEPRRDGRQDSRQEARGDRSRPRGGAPTARLRPPAGQGSAPRLTGPAHGGRPGGQAQPAVEREAKGVLDIRGDGSGYLRTRDNWNADPSDVMVPANLIRSVGLRPGQEIVGIARTGGRGSVLAEVETVEGLPAEEAAGLVKFSNLEAEIPFERLKLEINQEALGARIIDLLAPLGKGQRGLIVAPPQAGKTRILRDIATSIATRHPDTRLFMLLIDERPEEVTELRSMGIGQVVASTFDESRSGQLAAAELALERMQRLVEAGKDVFVLIDSLTRLSRASNLAIKGSGRSLSGGLDPAALAFPRKLFGAARATKNAGNLTILATALVETNSVMDEFVFQEFKGTGNWEVRLDRKLAQRRIFPAIDINASSTRREELLYSPQELNAVTRLRQYLWKFSPQPETRAERLVWLLSRTKSNAELLSLVERL